MNRFYSSKKHTILFIIMCVSVLLMSCRHNKEKVLVEQRYEFKEQDWDFTQRVIPFSFSISDTVLPCKILLELEYEKAPDEIDRFPIVFSLYAPDGAAYNVSSNFVFSLPDSSIKEANSSLFKTRTAVIYKEKYFNVSGKYRGSLYCYSPKYNNPGMHAVTLKIISYPRKNE